MNNHRAVLVSMFGREYRKVCNLTDFTGFEQAWEAKNEYDDIIMKCKLHGLKTEIERVRDNN